MQKELSSTEVMLRTLSLSAWVLIDSVITLFRRIVCTSGHKAVTSWRSTDLEFVVISQVPWDYLWQRNHHTQSRISEKSKVLYCCPIPTLSAAKEGTTTGSLTAHKHNDNLLTFRPLMLWGDSKLSLVRILNRLILRNYLKWFTSLNGMVGNRRVLWFYYPTYESLVGHLDEDLVLYDIQDEYSSFSWFPADTEEREINLIRKCDLVFTGTLQLWKRKKRHNPNMHFIQCGVESSHFGRSREETTVIPSDAAGLGKPVLGYFGLVDTRTDIDMLETVAARKPDWNILLIGPSHIEKKAPNIHMIGRRDYHELPGYLKAFDICLIPFVLNDNTRNINPTKLLEYFASGKPVISAPIPDVIDLFSGIVEIAGTPDEFIEAAERALSEDTEEKVEKRIREAEDNSWEGMVEKMLVHIERTFSR